MPFAANYSLSFTRVSRRTLNGIWSFLTPCSQASRFLLKRVKDSPKCFLLPGTELWQLIFTKRQHNEEAIFQKNSWRAHVSSMFSSSTFGKHCFQSQFLLPRCKLCLHYTAGDFNENSSMHGGNSAPLSELSGSAPGYECMRVFDQTSDRNDLVIFWRV